MWIILSVWLAVAVSVLALLSKLNYNCYQRAKQDTEYYHNKLRRISPLVQEMVQSIDIVEVDSLKTDLLSGRLTMAAVDRTMLLTQLDNLLTQYHKAEQLMEVISYD